LKAIVRWSDGVALRYGETKILFDPVESDPAIPDVFITHAHYDHSRGFQFPTQKETRELYEVDGSHKVGDWQQVRPGRRLKLGEVEDALFRLTKNGVLSYSELLDGHNRLPGQT